MQQHPGQFLLEHLSGLDVGEIAVVFPCLAVCLHNPVDELPETLLPRWSAGGAAEGLGRDDGRCVDAPEVGEFNALLLKDHLAGLPVRLHDVATFPGHLVVWMYTGGKDTLNA